MTTRELNLGKIAQLLPNCQDRAKAWMEDCFFLGFEFTITESYRSQERQNELYAKGRKNGVIVDKSAVVTYTLKSKHTARRALDVYPVGAITSAAVKMKLAQLERLGRHFGITRPAETLAFGDYVHFEILDVPVPVDSPLYQRVEKRRRDRITRTSSPPSP